ncbi:MAG TPA: DNA-binding protein [Bacteroidales bacterium]|nr:DNA-binding protein [Bacteroidales bacterium]
MEQIQFIQTSPDELAEKIRLIVREEFDRVSGKSNLPLKFSTRKETAARLRITLVSLDKYTAAGIIKGSRVGRRILYSEDDINNAVKEIATSKYRRK